MERVKTFVNGGREYPADLNAIQDRAAEMLEDTASKIPSSHFAGRFFRATDTGVLSLDTGTAWESITTSIIYGDGSDASVTLDGTATYAAFMTKVGSVYTLTRDVYASQFVINSGVTLKTEGFIVFCLTTLTNNGTIENNGGKGGSGASEEGIGGVGGGHGSLGGGTAGGSGGAGTSGAGGEGTSGAGAQGGIGAEGGKHLAISGGAPGIATPPVGGVRRQPIPLLLGNFDQSLITGGTGGGGGGAASGARGGGGGGGGGQILLACHWLINNGSINANGGAGGAGSVNGGNGGGGGGGAIYLLRKVESGSGTKSALGAVGAANGLIVSIAT